MEGRVRAAVDDTVSAYSGRSAVVLNLGARSKRSAKSRLGDPWMTSGGRGRPWEALGELWDTPGELWEGLGKLWEGLGSRSRSLFAHVGVTFSSRVGHVGVIFS